MLLAPRRVGLIARSPPIKTRSAPRHRGACARARRRSRAGLAHLRRRSLSCKPGPLLPDVQIFHEAVRFALHVQRILQARRNRGGAEAARSAAKSAPRNWPPGRRRGPRPPASWCAATSRRSTRACSRTAWSCRHRTRRTRRIAGVSTPGFTGATRR